ncbi:unnamed protein product [Vitrella brassicaformis CCMP3155]|uniref:Uncharacterized protein n=1 Tax=Vitrella brassicaformis (strain CCMP3155) TaxID=1169540 RepID=A0A0G4GYH7_VITBC|nr:unnamed protein product [Vitrella brassicaformis CCMP3155]|eukprot:CEM36043.1 unnamed protein product [Vitrella brassicaformis CCMP3155]
MNVVSDLEDWGSKATSFHPSCERALRGVGSDALTGSPFASKGCYDRISNALCKVKFESYEADVSCRETRDLTSDLIQTCDKDNALSRSAARCESYEVDSDRAESKTLSFSPQQRDDCEKISMAYNTCVQIGVGVLGYDRRYCFRGFNPYCKKYPAIITDPQYTQICSQVMVPFVVEEDMRSPSLHTSAAMCKDFYKQYLLYLTARRGDLMNKATAANESLASVGEALKLAKTYTSDATQLQDTQVKLKDLSTPVLDALRRRANVQQSVSAALGQQIDMLGEDANKMDEASRVVASVPLRSSDSEDIQRGDEAFKRVLAATDRAVDRLAKIQTMLGVKENEGPQTNKPPAGFVSVDPYAIEMFRHRIDSSLRKIKPYKERFIDSTNESVLRERQAQKAYKKQGVTFLSLADLVKRQMSALHASGSAPLAASPLVAAAEAASTPH